MNKEGQDSRTLEKKEKAVKTKTEGVVQPKRPVSAYLYFSIENMKNIRAKDPTIPMCECTKISSKTWNELSDNKKTKFNTMHEKDVARYQKELK